MLDSVRKLLLLILCVLSIVGSSWAQSKEEIKRMENEWQQISKTEMKSKRSVDILDSLAQVYIVTDTVKAHNYLNKALNIANELRYWDGVGNTLLLYGNIDLMHANYLAGLKYFLKTRHLMKSKGDERQVVHSDIRIATAYTQLGDYDRALKTFSEAEPYLRKKKEYQNLGVLNFNMGDLFYNMQMYQKSLSDNWISLGYFKKSHNMLDETYVYNNIGRLYEVIGKPDSAYTYAIKGMKLRKKFNDKTGLSYSYFNIGNIFLDKKDYKKALYYHRMSADIRKKLGLKRGLSFSYYEIGMIYLKTGDYSKALSYAKRSLKLANQIHYPMNQKRALSLLTEIEATMGNYKTALADYKIYDAVKDSLFNKSKTQRFEELSTIYETKRKEQEIGLLKKDQDLQQAKLKKEVLYRNLFLVGILLLLVILLLIAYGYRMKNRSERILKSKNHELTDANNKILENENVMMEQAAELRKNNEALDKQNKLLANLNDEKNEFLRIAAHDLKNPLLGIYSMAQLMSDTETYMKNAGGADTLRKHIHLIEESAGRMIKLVNNLVDVNTIESNRNKLDIKSVDIGDIIEKSIQNYTIQARNKDISLKINLPESSVLFNTDADVTYRIIDNLLSNAIKYSPFHKTVWVTVEQNSECLRLSVKDEGLGISEEDREKLFKKFARLSTIPTNGEQSTGLGLYIVKGLVEKLNGKIHYNEQWTKGAEFIVELPLSSKV